MIRLVKLHLKLSKKGESIKFSGREIHMYNLTVERKNEYRLRLKRIY